MEKILTILFIIAIMMGCTYASSQTIEINGTQFELPSKYQGGELKDDSYYLDNIFSISCIDDDICEKVGLWAAKKDFSQDITIRNHPVRHFIQYNKYVDGNHSHAYFASNHSIYEISWTSNEINSDIKKLIENTPESEINDDAFYSALDEAANIYKQQKIDKLNQETEYNYLETKYHPQAHQEKSDDTRLKEILLTYY